MLYPATTIDALRPSAIANVYEIDIGRDVVYTDATGRYFLFGHLVDMKDERDLTVASLQRAMRVDWRALNLEHAIVTVHGKGKRKLH